MNSKKKMRIFNKVVEPEYTRIFNFIYSRLDRNRELAEDITQDTFEIAWHKLEQLKNIESSRAWLMQITMNEIRKYYRAQSTEKRGKFQEESYDLQELERLELPDQVEADVLDHIIAMESHELLMNALNRVQEKYRILLDLRLIQDLKFSQIAEIMQMDETKTRVYYGRGVKILGKEYYRLTGKDKNDK